MGRWGLPLGRHGNRAIVACAGSSREGGWLVARAERFWSRGWMIWTCGRRTSAGAAITGAAITGAGLFGAGLFGAGFDGIAFDVAVPAGPAAVVRLLLVAVGRVLSGAAGAPAP